MGTCCSAHLVDKVRDYSQHAKDKTVTVIHKKTQKCDYCNAPGEFVVSYITAEQIEETGG